MSCELCRGYHVSYCPACDPGEPELPYEIIETIEAAIPDMEHQDDLNSLIVVEACRYTNDDEDEDGLIDRLIEHFKEELENLLDA